MRALAEGEEPTVGAALRRAAPRLPAAAGAVVLYSLGVALGLVALVVPGIWLGVRWYFAAQAAAVDGLGPWTLLRARRSCRRAGGGRWGYCWASARSSASSVSWPAW